ncbi:MAG: BatA domain-containing protein [Planctomycetes bacterium]|nr:BatA domain-containing protein [Planctomycetota bacterium]
MNSLAFQHPWALWALCLLPAVAWLALRGRRGAVHATGTLGLWRRTLETPRTEPPRARRTLPLSAWVALAALVFGIAALAHPTAQAAPRAGPAWTLVVDRSPSMYLPAPTDERSLATLGLASAGGRAARGDAPGAGRPGGREDVRKRRDSARVAALAQRRSPGEVGVRGAPAPRGLVHGAHARTGSTGRFADALRVPGPLGLHLGQRL